MLGFMTVYNQRLQKESVNFIRKMYTKGASLIWAKKKSEKTIQVAHHVMAHTLRTKVNYSTKYIYVFIKEVLYSQLRMK